MADFTLPRPRRQFGGSLNIPGYARALPNAYGTDTYQAGIPQDRESTLSRVTPEPIGMAGPSPGMPSDKANNQLRAEQSAALAAHAQYRQRLNTLGDMNQVRQNDLKLAENLLIATDPQMDKSVRKFMLAGLSSAVGVDPKGEYSKNLQAMVMQLQPENLEAMRMAFVPDIQNAPPGSISKGLEGLFNGSIPVENVMKQVKIDQQNRLAAGAAATEPPPEQLMGAPAPAAAPAAPAATPRVPGAGVTAVAGRAAPGTGGLAGLAQVTQPPPTAEVAQLSRPSIDQPGAQVGGGTIEVTPGAPAEGGGEPPAEPVTPQAPRPQGAPPVSTPPAEGGGFYPSVAAAAEAAGAGVTAPGPEIGTDIEPSPPPPGPPPAGVTDVGAAYGAPGTAQAAGSAGAGAAQQVTAPITTGAVPAMPAPVTGPAGATTPQPPAAPAPAGQAPAAPAAPPGAITAEEANRSVLGLPQIVEPKEGAPPPKTEAEFRSTAPPLPKPGERDETGKLVGAPDLTEPSYVTQKVRELNANPPPREKTPNLQPLDPDKRPEEDQPFPNSVKQFFPHLLDPRLTYSLGDAQRAIPNASNDKEWVKEVRKEGPAAQNSYYEIVGKSLELQELLKVSTAEGLRGGFHPEFKTPWGSFNFGEWNQGGWTSFTERAKAYLGDSKMTQPEIEDAFNRARQFAQKHSEGKSLTGEEKSILEARIESVYIGLISAKAIAQNNNSKQIANQDFKNAEREVGNLLNTGPQAMALNQANTQSSLQAAQRKFAAVSGDANMPVSFANMNSAERTTAIERAIRLGPQSAVPPSVLKELLHADQDARNPGKREYLTRTGNLEEDYTAAKQAKLGEEDTRKKAGELRAQAHEERAQRQEVRQERAAALAELRFEAQQARQQRQEMAQAFSRIAAALSKGAHMPSMGAPSMGGEQDSSAFRLTPTPQRTPPRPPGVSWQRPKMGK